MIVMIGLTLHIYSQAPENGIQSRDSLFKAGKLRRDQLIKLRRECYNIAKNQAFPGLTTNIKTGEIEISDTLTFTNLDKKVIFQRCLQWIAINNGYLIYSDLESGKIIANGLIDLSHFAEFSDGYSGTAINKIQTSTSYTMILTMKDNKIRYTITNISYSFTNFSETTDQISFAISDLFPIETKDQTQWVRFISVIYASTDKFYYKLKDYLIDYISEAENDYKF